MWQRLSLEARLAAAIESAAGLKTERAEAKVVAVGVIEQTDGQIGKNNLPFRGDGVYTIDLELVNIDDAYGKEEKVWAIVDVKLATMEERGGKNFAAYGWLTKHLPDVAAGVKPNPRQRTW